MDMLLHVDDRKKEVSLHKEEHTRLIRDRIFFILTQQNLVKKGHLSYTRKHNYK